MAFTALGNLLSEADGGLYNRSAPNDPAGTWDSLNGCLGAIDAYQIAYDPPSHLVFVAS